MTEHASGIFGRHPVMPIGTRPEWLTLHDAYGTKRIKRLRHPFNQQLADRRYWVSLLSSGRQAHVTGVLTTDETFIWSANAPRPTAVLGDNFDAASIKTLFEAGHTADIQQQIEYPWALVNSVTDAGAFQFGGFLSLVAPHDMRLRLATFYGLAEITQFLGTIEQFIIQYGDELRAANARLSNDGLYFV